MDRRGRCSARSGVASVTRVAAATWLALAVMAATPLAAHAQMVVTAVNGDPITTFDIDTYMKILRIEHKPASRSDALEAVVADRLKYDEARHWGLDASDTDLTSELQKVAASVKLDANGFSQEAAKAKIDLDTIRYHLRAAGAWDNLVRARNKGVGVTEEEISAAIAKGDASQVTNYRLQEVIFVLPVNPAPAVIEARMTQAKALRNRFTGCETGLQVARSLPDVAVKETMSRTSDALTPAVRKVLGETPRGMLTPPERSINGIEMLAVCDKNNVDDATTVRERVQKDLIGEKLKSVSAQMYKDLRKTAVVSKN